MDELVIFGIGGHAREVAQLVADINQAQPGRWQLLGFVADPKLIPRNLKPLPAPLLGDAHWLTRNPGLHVVIAVGSPSARRSIAQRLRHAQPDVRFATLVHPRSWLAERVSLGQGSVVFAGALINVDVTLGDHCSINLGATLSHDCLVGDYVSLGPGSHLAGGVRVGNDTDVGTGATLRPGVRLGAGAIIGAGAVVVHELPDGCTAFGVPARPIRFMRDQEIAHSDLR
jgi:sugar O-acyltransferase (sialic acid O-acetyltransferase NeuD family)